MRAVVVERYGPPESAVVQEVPTPEPGPGEVLVRVASAAVTSGDARMRSGVFPPGFALPARLAIGMRGPRRRILGAAFSGEIAALGEGVTDRAVGERVAGMGGARPGAHAEYLTVAAARAAPVPDAVGHDAAAAVQFGGTTALSFLRDKGGIRPGATVLVNGASGAVGTSAVQLARLLGGVVTGVTSAPNVELVRRLGAERVVDYRETPVESLVARGERFDLVLDTVGNVGAASGRRLLAEDGTVLLVMASFGELVTARGNVKAGSAPIDPDHVAELLRLLAEGALDPVIESTHPLDGIAEAYRRVDSGRKVGNILVRPGE